MVKFEGTKFLPLLLIVLFFGRIKVLKMKIGDFVKRKGERKSLITFETFLFEARFICKIFIPV